MKPLNASNHCERQPVYGITDHALHIRETRHEITVGAHPNAMTGRHMTPPTTEQDATRTRWTFMTNHAAALLHVAEHPDSTIREVAASVGVTERAAARILKDLRDDGYLEVVRVGRRNAYNVDLSR